MLVTMFQQNDKIIFFRGKNNKNLGKKTLEKSKILINSPKSNHKFVNLSKYSIFETDEFLNNTVERSQNIEETNNFNKYMENKVNIFKLKTQKTLLKIKDIILD